MVIALGLLLVLATVINIVFAWFGSIIKDTFGGSDLISALNVLALLGVIALANAFVYKVLPDVKIAWRDVWPGSITATFLMALGGLVIGLYFKLGGVSSAFEAAGAFAVMMISIYYFAQIFLVGAIITRLYATEVPARGESSLLNQKRKHPKSHFVNKSWGIPLEFGLSAERDELLAGGFHWENLTGIQDVLRIQRLLDAPLDFDRNWSQGVFQVRALEHTHPVLARKRPTQLQGCGEDLANHLLDLCPLVRLALVKQDVGMQVAIPGVPENHHRQAVFGADDAQPLDHVWDGAARHGDIFAQLVGRLACQ